jgi:hypothetical protein
MSFVLLSQAYKIAPSRRDAARTQAPAPLQAPATNPDAHPHHARHGERDGAQHREGDVDRGRDCDSASRSPLMRALIQALQPAAATGGRADLVLERALIAFARALNLATNDAETTPHPAAARADEVARRRASLEEELLDAFAALQRAAARPGAVSRAVLQAQLGAFLHELARQLNIDEERAGEATQPGSLISVHA